MKDFYAGGISSTFDEHSKTEVLKVEKAIPPTFDRFDRVVDAFDQSIDNAVLEESDDILSPSLEGFAKGIDL